MRRARSAKGTDTRTLRDLPAVVVLLLAIALAISGSACSTGRKLQGGDDGPAGTGGTAGTGGAAVDGSRVDALADGPHDGSSGGAIGAGGNGAGGSATGSGGFGAGIDGGVDGRGGNGAGGSGTGGSGTGGSGTGGSGSGGVGGATGSGGHIGTGGSGSGGMGMGGSGVGGSCQPPLKLCLATCIATASDAANCGNCGAACAANEQCVNSGCQCVSPRLACGNACIDATGDAHNCGACGHDCLGGTCSSGHCQPVTVATNLASLPTVFGVDGTNVYFSAGSASANGAFRVARTAVSGAPTPIITGLAATFPGVIGGSMLMRSVVGGIVTLKVCDVTGCVVPSGTFISGDDAIPFRTAVPAFFATTRLVNPGSTGSGTADLFFDWWGAGVLVHETTNNILNTNLADLSFFAGADSVYWMSNNGSAKALLVSEMTDNNLFGLAGGMAVNIGWSIVDANARSVLLLSSTNVLYRALVGVHSSAPPTQLAALPGAATGFAGATEDATLVYWLDSQGTVSSCSPSSCPGTQTTLTSGQTSPSGFYQDASALYWGRSTPNAVMRLAK